jgi:hypothetical protein
VLEDHQLASVDILGEADSSFERFAGRTLLAEFLFHSLPEGEQKSPLGEAADAAENETLPEMADSPGFSLRDVEVRLAYAYRLLLWAGQGHGGPYPEAATRMVATSLADVVLMRTAERARPRPAETEEPAEDTLEPSKPLPTVTMALEQVADLLRGMTALFAEQQEELRRLHGERKEEPAAA